MKPDVVLFPHSELESEGDIDTSLPIKTDKSFYSSMYMTINKFEGQGAWEGGLVPCKITYFDDIEQELDEIEAQRIRVEQVVPEKDTKKVIAKRHRKPA